MKRTINALIIFSVFILCVDAQVNVTWQGQNALSGLKNSYSDSNWLSQPSALFEINNSTNLETTLQSRIKEDGNLELLLTIKNTGGSPIVAEPVFPLLYNICPEGTASASLYCFFPKQGELASNLPNINFEEAYCGTFPFQFIDVYVPDKGGIYIMTEDTQNNPKDYFLQKSSGKVRMGVKYRPQKLEPGETWILPPASINAHEGDWHGAFYQYRDWVQTWYKPVSERKTWFRDVYNFRQLFLHRIFGEDGAFNTSTGKINLQWKVDDSIDAFGGVDYVHLFDWGQSPSSGRCGDYVPWDYYGENMKTELSSQIQALESKGIKTGLYHEGYLLSKVSSISKQEGLEWQMLNANGNPHSRMGNEYTYPCPHLEEWREYLSNTVSRSSSTLGVSGIYIDQYGFGWQYPCYNPNHNHDLQKTGVAGECQVPAEAGMMKAIRSKLSDNVVTYTEECPTDVSTQFQDGSFSYGVFFSRNKNTNPAGINLVRFAFPDFKIFELLHVDVSFGNDIDGVKRVFFNGNGLWLEGPLNNTTWFTPEVRSTIKKCYGVLKRNVENFRSPNPMPLVPTLFDGVYANSFHLENKKLWTIYNSYSMDLNIPVIETQHFEGAVYYDEWDQREITPVITNGKAIISLNMEANYFGCISQRINGTSGNIETSVEKEKIEVSPSLLKKNEPLYVKNGKGYQMNWFNTQGAKLKSEWIDTDNYWTMAGGASGLNVVEFTGNALRETHKIIIIE